MSWRVIAQSGVHGDVAEAATCYEEKEPGLGADFVDEIFAVWDALGENPWLNSRRDVRRNIRWRLAQRFPYRIVYEIDEGEHAVIIYGVIHAARHDSHWKRRL